MTWKSFAPMDGDYSILSILSRISIFGGVTELQLDEVLHKLEVARFEPGEFVFQKGDEPTHIYIVKSGKIDLIIGDDELVFQKRELGVGECFGTASLISMHRHTATARAAEPSEVVVLSKQSLNQLRIEDPALFSLLILNIARELARSVHQTDAILLKSLHHPTGVQDLSRLSGL